MSSLGLAFSLWPLCVGSFTWDPEPLSSAKQEFPLLLVLLFGLTELGDIVKSGIDFYQVLHTAWEQLEVTTPCAGEEGTVP